MKKILATILSILFLFSSFSQKTNAATPDVLIKNFEIVSQETEYFSDGTSLTITIFEEKSSSLSRSTIYTKSGTKSYSLKNSDGDTLWTFTIKGTFSVTSGVSSTCTSTSYSTSNLSSGWGLDSASTYASSNNAIGDATFVHKTLFIVTETKNCHVVLTCDENGNLS